MGALAGVWAGPWIGWMAGYQGNGWAAWRQDGHREGTVADSVTVLVTKRDYSFCYKRLFLPGFQGKQPTPATGRQARLR